MQLCVADIEAAHAELSSRGVPMSPVQHHDGSGMVDGKGDDWNSFIFFDDPDGNSWAIQESPTMRAAAVGRRLRLLTCVDALLAVAQPTASV